MNAQLSLKGESAPVGFLKNEKERFNGLTVIHKKGRRDRAVRMPSSFLLGSEFKRRSLRLSRPQQTSPPTTTPICFTCSQPANNSPH